MYKQIRIYIVVILFFSACDDTSTVDSIGEVSKNGFQDIKNPEKYLQSLSESFKIESVKKEDINSDGFLDMEILGLLGNGEYKNFYFLNVEGKTYRMVMEDEFYSYDEELEEIVEFDSIEAYFEMSESEAEVTLLKTKYADINNDGYQDAIAVTYYFENYKEAYESNDATIFYGNENGTYSYASFCELNFIKENKENLKFLDIIAKDNYFSFEFGNEKRKEIITFKYDEAYSNIKLHKHGTILYDENKMLLEEKVLTVEDFGEKKFEEYSPGDFIYKETFTVSTSKEFLQALGSDREIRLEEGTYHLNNAENFPDISQIDLQKIKEYRGVYYAEEFYTLSTYSENADQWAYNTEISIRNIQDTKIVGLGNVRIIVDNEFLSILSFRNCSKIEMENIYLVHEVEGECGGNVVEIDTCAHFNFKNVIFDGSGQIGVDSHYSKNISFKECNITNCTEGAVYGYNFDARFENCSLSKNSVFSGLVALDNHSNLVFDHCVFEGNMLCSYADEEVYLFEIEINSSIRMMNECVVKNNVDFRITNNSNSFETDNTFYE